MKKMFEAWPELVLIDSTYQLLQLEYPLVIIAIVDGNGATELVGMCIVVQETEETFRWMIEQLIKHNPVACSKIRSFMTDKDMVARRIIKELIQVPVYMCSFHVSQIFRRTVTMENMEINKQQKETCLRHLQKLLYSRSEEEYTIHYANFCKEAPSNVLNYYNVNWHSVKYEWVRGFLCESNFNNLTNNRIESFNQKLKLFLEKHSYLTNFLEQLFAFLAVHQNERNTLAKNVSRRPTFEMTNDEEKYFSLLTNYGFKYVSQQMEEMIHVKFVCKIEDTTYVVKSAASETIKYYVTPTSCTCSNFKSMGLPCRHLLKIRKIENISLYDALLCKKRWTREYLNKNHRLHQKK